MSSTGVLLTISQGRRRHKTLPHHPFFLGFFISLVILSACVPYNRAEPQNAWEYADLRALAPADGPQADLDLIALYSRFAGSDFQIRLDLLDLDTDAQLDLYLALDTTPGGTRVLPFQAQAEIDWDLLLFFPQSGSPQAFSPPTKIGTDFPRQPDIIPRISRYPWLDSLLISINPNLISTFTQRISIEAFILQAGNTAVADRIGPARTDSLPPGKANLLIAFWNSFPAYTPAQALRRWDGAHTGPYGEHHGLHVLLQNVRRYQIPIALLDLKNPASLSAVELVGGIPVLQNLVERDLLILPDVVTGSPSFSIFPDMLPNWAVHQAIQDSRNVAQHFGLPASRILYTPRLLPDLPTDYPIMFIPQMDRQINRWKNARLIQVPIKSSEQAATADGLALELRRELLSIALQNTADPGTHHVLVLGGSLPDSAFGDPQASQATLLYIAAHPWMHALGGADLFRLPPDMVIDHLPDQPNTSPKIPTQPFSSLLTDLNRPDENHSLDNTAWQAALTLYSPLPPEPPDLIDLRSIYSDQVGIFQLAAAWAKSPQTIHECTADLDRDGLPECLLATPNSLAIFDLLGGRLLALFHTSEGQVHQIIGSTSQFLVGQADPSSWDLNAGDAADPGVIPGAFIDGLPPWELYQPEFSSNSLMLTAPGGSLFKTFTIKENGIVVNYDIIAPLNVRIPLVLDPWQRFSPGWGERYRTEQIFDGFTWQIIDGPRLVVHSSVPVKLEPFTVSLTDLRRPEDPNFEYPPGHYLAFPIAVVELDALNDFQVEIDFSDQQADN